MTPQELIVAISKAPVKPLEVCDNYGTVFVTVNAENIFRFGKFLKETTELDFNLLEYAYGTDWLEKNQIEVGYFLTSITHQHDVVLRCFVPRTEPQLNTLINLWSAAHGHEREIFDLLGVKFIGHPNLTRILTPPGIEGHPLRKDYAHPEFEPLPK